MKFILPLFMISSVFAACTTSSEFKQVGIIGSEKISEASGMDFSRQHQNVFWTHNDSADSPMVFALNAEGKKVAQFQVQTVVNDWEDISVGKCIGGEGDCLYIADTGNKRGKRKTLQILMIEEPKELVEGMMPVKKTITFASGNHNFESLAVDDSRQQFYLLNKKGRRFDPIDQKKGLVVLFALKFAVPKLLKVATFDFTRIPNLEPQDTLVTSADYNEANDTLLIGSYGKAFEIGVKNFKTFIESVTVHALPILEKSEAMAYSGNDIVVTSEGKNPPLYKMACQ